MSEKLHPDVEELLRYNREACTHEFVWKTEKAEGVTVRFQICHCGQIQNHFPLFVDLTQVYTNDYWRVPLT